LQYKPEEVGKKQHSGKSSVDGTLQTSITVLKPSVVLTRLAEPRLSTPHGSPQAVVKSEPGSRKNSFDEESRESLAKTGEETPKSSVSPSKSPSAASTSANQSTKQPLKRKIGPASRMSGKN